MTAPEKTWWAPLWRGLVVDPAGKHARGLKDSVWLLLYLILHADRRTGRLRCRLSIIVRDMGRPRRTIQRWMRRLRAQAYIEVRRTGRAPEIGILRWRPVGGASRLALQRRHDWHTRDANTDTSRAPTSDREADRYAGIS